LSEEIPRKLTDTGNVNILRRTTTDYQSISCILFSLSTKTPEFKKPIEKVKFHVSQLYQFVTNHFFTSCFLFQSKTLFKLTSWVQGKTTFITKFRIHQIASSAHIMWMIPKQ
jgi:hypothetical protein